jgi:hypothetical protein
MHVKKNVSIHFQIFIKVMIQIINFLFMFHDVRTESNSIA